MVKSYCTHNIVIYKIDAKWLILQLLFLNGSILKNVKMKKADLFVKLKNPNLSFEDLDSFPESSPISNEL